MESSSSTVGSRAGSPAVAQEQDGVLRIDPAVVAEYERAGWWGRTSVSDLVRGHAERTPEAAAYSVAGRTRTWREYDELADRVAQVLRGLGHPRGERVGVLLPDGMEIHGVLVGCARAGLVAVGIGARAGVAEVEHLLRRTGARALVTHPQHRGQDAAALVAGLRGAGLDLAHLVLDEDGALHSDAPRASYPSAAEPLGPSEVSMLNSTSGTTGLPKCVTQFDNRWLHFSDLAIEAGRLRPDDVVLAVVPTPFGFGLWTSHFVGARLGARTVVMPRFDADDLARLVESERATVLCCVSTQFRMLLNSPEVDRRDLTSLRVMFTGGEAVPFDRALEFERRTGATVLQFYGSNETGALSRTTLEDDAETRLRTSGRALAHMQVRVLADDGTVLDGAATGRPAGRGPLTCAGYWGDPEANAELVTDDGWMLMGDVVRRDAEGRIAVVGRSNDIIIRGGKNISALEVEELVDTHPAVALVGVVPVPDPVFGERACAVVLPHPGAELTLADLADHLAARGVTKDLLPERLVVVGEMPRSSGGKLARAELRRIAEAALQG